MFGILEQTIALKIEKARPNFAKYHINPKNCQILLKISTKWQNFANFSHTANLLKMCVQRMKCRLAKVEIAQEQLKNSNCTLLRVKL